MHAILTSPRCDYLVVLDALEIRWEDQASNVHASYSNICRLRRGCGM
jgi:hypothetical protein